MKYENIKKNKFYKAHNKDSYGHPSLVVKKDDEKQDILIVKFTSDKKYKDVEKEPLKFRIDENVPEKPIKRKKDGELYHTYVVKYPYVVKSNVLSYSKKYENYRISKEDKRRIYNIKRRKPK